MNKDKLSGIVVYTIHDNDALRNALCKALEDNLKAEFLDESTYGIAIQGEIDAVDILNSICNTVQKNSNSTFGEKDFVSLYRPTYYENTDKNRYIRQTRII